MASAYVPARSRGLLMLVLVVLTGLLTALPPRASAASTSDPAGVDAGAVTPAQDIDACVSGVRAIVGPDDDGTVAAHCEAALAGDATVDVAVERVVRIVRVTQSVEPCTPALGAPREDACVPAQDPPAEPERPAARTASFSAANAGGSISGAVLGADSGAGVPEICVDVFDDLVSYGTTTGADGSYVVDGVADGVYVVYFSDCGAITDPAYAPAYYDGTRDFDQAVHIEVLDGVAVAGIDAVLDRYGSISGTVLSDVDGSAADGTCVFAYDDEYLAAYSTEVSADGTYTLAQVLPGALLTVEFYDCRDGRFVWEYYDDVRDFGLRTQVSVGQGEALVGIDAGLAEGGRIAGTVIDAVTSLPVDGICISAYDTGFGYGGGATSGVDGTYVIGGLEPGSYEVEAFDCSGSGYVFEVYPDVVLVSSGQTVTGIDFALRQGGRIAGTVSAAADGAPLEFICVSANDVTGNGFGFAQTGADGTYEIRGLVDGDYVVEFSNCNGTDYIGQFHDGASSYEDATPVTVVAPDTVAGIDAALVLGSRISGTVTAATDGSPLADICVYAFDPEGGQFRDGAGFTDVDGGYTVRGLPTGSYVVEFQDCSHGGTWAPELYDGVRSLELATLVSVTAPNEVTGIDADLDPAGSISGTVLAGDTGDPLPDVCVYAELRDMDGWGWWFGGGGVTDVDGTYTVTGLAPGDHVVEFYDCGTGQYLFEYYDDVRDLSLATPVTVVAGLDTPGIDAVLDLAGSMSGVVRADDTGEPLGDVCVGAIEDSGFWYGFAYSEPDGSWFMPDLVPGSYRVEFYDCSGSGLYGSEWYDDVPTADEATLVVVVGARTTSGIDASLGAAGRISGTVTAQDTGLALEDVCVYASSDRDGGFAYTGPDGTYVLGGLVDTGYVVDFADCGGRGYQPEFYDDVQDFALATRVPVSSGGETPGIDAALAPGGRVTGTVTASDTGAPLPDVCVDAYVPEGFGYGFGYTGADGTYEILGLPSGSYLVAFFDCSGFDEYRPEFHRGVRDPEQATLVQVVAPGTVSDLDADLDPYEVGTGTISGTVRTSGGAAVSGAFVSTCGPDGRCRSTTTASNGSYLLDRLTDGSYTVTASPPTSNLRSGRAEATVTGGGDTLGVGIVLQTITAPPTGTTVSSSATRPGQTVPTVIVGDPFTIGTTAPPCESTGTVTYTITSETGEVVTGVLPETPPGSGNFAGDIVVPFAGTADVVISQEGCPNTVAFNIYIDPSGYVKTPAGDPIEGATVTLLRADAAEGPFVVVPDGSNLMDPSNRTNPDLTDANGHFGWNVSAGFYKVRASKSGCTAPGSSDTSVDSPVYEIPPAVTDVDLRLDCSGVSGGLEFIPITPCAVFDTRGATGGFTGRLAGGTSRTFTVTGTIPLAQGGAGCAAPPASAVAVELNLIALDASGSGTGNLQVSATGTVPGGGVVNFAQGQNNSNALSVEVDSAGQIDVRANGPSVHVRGVVLGYHTSTDASGLEFLPVTPCAVFDTRAAIGASAGKLSGSSRTFQVAGTVPGTQGGNDCTAPPAGALAVELNLVALDSAAGTGNLQVSAAGSTPGGGVVNFSQGQNNSNSLSVQLTQDKVDVRANGPAVHVRGVVLGYYTAIEGAGLELVPVTPCAVFDTRSATGASAGKLASSSRTFTIAGAPPAHQGGSACSAPPVDAQVVELNLVALNVAGTGNLQAAAAGATPGGGIVNFRSGQNNSNAHSLAVDSGGRISVTANGPAVDVRGVVLGYRVPGR